jgi:hypothetical protein
MMTPMRMMSPSPPTTEPMMMAAAVVLLLDSEGTGDITGGVARGLVHCVGEGPVKRPVGVYVNLMLVLFIKLSGTHPVK